MTSLLGPRALARANAVELTYVQPGRYRAASESHPGRMHEVSVMVSEYPACNMVSCDCPCQDCAEGRHVGCRIGIKREQLWVHCSCPGGRREDSHGSSTCRHAQAVGLRLLASEDERAAVPASRIANATDDEVFAGL